MMEREVIVNISSIPNVPSVLEEAPGGDDLIDIESNQSMSKNFRQRLDSELSSGRTEIAKPNDCPETPHGDYFLVCIFHY